MPYIPFPAYRSERWAVKEGCFKTLSRFLQYAKGILQINSVLFQQRSALFQNTSAHLQISTALMQNCSAYFL